MTTSFDGPFPKDIAWIDSPFYGTDIRDIAVFTLEEGRLWRRMQNEGVPVRFHSVRMKDGREWDCINGWRSIDSY